MAIHERVSMLSAQEVAELLGMATDAARSMLRRKGVSPVRVGTKQLYSCAELQRSLGPRAAGRLLRAASAKGLALRDPEGTVFGHPHLGPYWHPTFNEGLKPWRIGHSSKLVVWWKCPEGPDHVWRRPIDKALKHGRFTGCPYCTGRRASVTNSLAKLRPRAARYWHPVKNGKVTPSDVLARSPRRFWWRCEAGPDHEWYGGIPVGDQPCPFCDNRRLSVTNSLATVAPAAAAQWHPTRNGTLLPVEVKANDTTPRWWKCPRGPDHQWRTSPKNRAKGGGCPFCAATNRSVSEGYNLQLTHPALAAEWDWEANSELTPSTILPGSAKSVAWKCAVGHRWRSSPNERTRKYDSGFAPCPYCAGCRPGPGTSLADVAPEIAAEWHPTRNGVLTPHDVLPGSRTRVWWRCARGHEWDARVSQRGKRRSACPYCSGRLVAPEDSLAAKLPDMARQWHPTKNRGLTPWDVGARSGRAVWWKCENGHVWRATVGYRIRRKEPLACARCGRGRAM